ncbi:MAG: amidohydrolase family protein [bacterium]|nr:amidohydrolase family protein [bacterium]
MRKADVDAANDRAYADLQVNGYAGVDFSAAGLTLAAVRRVAQALAARGTAAFCPTIITAPAAVYEQNLPVLAAACETDELASSLLGIHLEGPFLSPQPGARGCHHVEWMQAPAPALLEHWQTLARGHVKLLTLAPELPGACETIQCACALGIVVSLGHTNANEHQILRAVAAGARCATHLGNAFPRAAHPRDNAMWWLLGCDALSAMCITDGHHLNAAFIKTVLRTKGVDKFIVVSDAAPVAGLPPGAYDCMGMRVVLEANGRVSSPDTGTLAGSAATLGECAQHLAALELLTAAQLRQVTRANARNLLGFSP